MSEHRPTDHCMMDNGETTRRKRYVCTCGWSDKEEKMSDQRVSDEVLRMWANAPDGWDYDKRAMARELLALRAQARQEPVAWREWDRANSWWVYYETAMPNATPLYASPVAQEGFVMVPKEPTDEQLNILKRVADHQLGNVNAYRNLLAAAPKPGEEK